LITGSLHIRAEYQGARRQVYLLKPLTTALILLLALQASASVNAAYKGFIVAGLFFSLVGDVFLMLPDDLFIPGLASFLAAHLCYIAAFSARAGFQASWPGLLPFLLYAAVMLILLWPHVGKARLPVLAYMAAILVMGWQALEQRQVSSQPGALFALGGALLFILSDSVLALNRFRRPFPSAQAIILVAYYAGQWLIALSVRS
jgi:uncharacterized membrane protein YhhN